MKKIFMVLIVLISIFIIPSFKVNALEDSFYEGEYISGEYMKKFKDGKGKYQQLRFFRRKSDNQAVYCIELWETLSQNKNIIGYDNNQSQYANISESTWQRIMLIAYYGYGYKNHTDSKWYVITQFMIWQETSPESNIYFTDTLNGNKITKYENEINEINLLIQNHSNLPSFNNQKYELRYNEKFTIIDTNNVLSEYDVRGNGGLTYTKENNQLTVVKKTANDSQFKLIKKDKLYSTSPIVYIDDNGQNLMAAGSYYPIYSSVNFYLPTTTITINKIDSENKNNVSQGEASLIGSKFQLLDNEYQVVAESTVNEDKKVVFNNVKYGSYYIKEISPGEGYLLNEQIIPIEVNEEKIIDFSNQVIKNTITINKYIKNPITNEIKLEKDASFIILNKNNEIVSTFKTDDKGTYKITLPYGNYILRQTSGMKNHLFIEDINIEVLENNKTQTFNLYNEEITAKIKVINIDDDSKLPIIEGKSTYKIKNTDTNEYLKDENNKDIILETNKGITEIIELSSGNYMIEQITPVEGYELNKEYYKFSIDDEIEFKIDEKGNNYIEIIIPNIKQKAELEIEKYIEYYLDDNLINKEKDNNFKITVYAKEDIYSKDGIKLYDKDSEVVILDNDIDKKISLILGNYYMINPIDNEVIDIILDKVETKKITLIDKVKEYTKVEIPEESEIIIDVPNTYLNDSKLTYLGSVFILLGLSILKKEKND